MAEAEAELQAGDEASAPAAEAHTVQFDENPTTVKADENEDDDVPEAEELAQFWEAVREGDQEIIDELLVGDEEHPPIGVKVNEQVLSSTQTHTHHVRPADRHSTQSQRSRGMLLSRAVPLPCSRAGRVREDASPLAHH